MKTKNVKVKIKDVKQGRIIYIAHPVYGITKILLESKPYIRKGIGWFAKGKKFNTCSAKYIRCTFSLRDSGISAGNSYNGRRSFFKLEQAQEWCNKWENDKGFIKQHKKHIDFMKEWDNY